MAAALAALWLGGCAQRADIDPDPAAIAATQIVSVYVGTTRARIPGALWSSAEPGQLNYARVDVSVPDSHTPGVIRLPGAQPDPETDFLTRRIVPFADPADFRGEIARMRATSDASAGEVVVTVHGFNNTMGDGVLRAAQMIHDFEMPGPTFHYAWPSRGAPLAYAADRDAALLARDGLEQMLDDLRDAGAPGIVIVAHSMGSHLTMEVLRQMALSGNRATLSRLRGVVLLSPDIDPALFRSQAETIGVLPQPFVIFASRNDPALRLSARLTGHPNRLGNIASIDDVAGLDVTVIDLTSAKDAASAHLAALTSPSVISFLKQTEALRRGLQNDVSGRTGVLPGAVLVAEEAAAVVLAPAAAIEQNLGQ